MSSSPGISYLPLPTEEENPTFSLKQILSYESQVRSGNTSEHQRRAWIFLHRPWSTYLARLGVLATFVSLFLFAWSTTQSPSLRTCLVQTSSYSPAFEAVKYYDTDFANAFDQKSPYRGPPTPELEKAWSGLWKQPQVLIPPEGMAKLNRSGEILREYVMFPGENGIGYIGNLEVFHQLHCLNYIRQFTWLLMDKYTEETMPLGLNLPLKATRMHTDHCIETLRIALMCSSDVTPVLAKWSSEDPPVLQADFNSHHRCRKFDDIVAWNKAHGLSIVIPDNHHTHEH